MADAYWLDTAPAFVGDAGDVAARPDVAIVGGGLTGLSAALALARRGASVSLLEQGRVAGEASGRNGGQCNNGTLQNYAALAAKVGIDRARYYYQTYNSAVDTVERLVQEEASTAASSVPANSSWQPSRPTMKDWRVPGSPCAGTWTPMFSCSVRTSCTGKSTPMPSMAA